MLAEISVTDLPYDPRLLEADKYEFTLVGLLSEQQMGRDGIIRSGWPLGRALQGELAPLAPKEITRALLFKKWKWWAKTGTREEIERRELHKLILSEVFHVRAWLDGRWVNARASETQRTAKRRGGRQKKVLSDNEKAFAMKARRLLQKNVPGREIKGRCGDFSVRTLKRWIRLLEDTA